MPKKQVLYRSSRGLNMAVDPVRTEWNPQTGVVDLQACSNIELDSTGRISRRKGFSALFSGRMHSVFSCGSYALAVWIYSSYHHLIWFDGTGESGMILALENYNDRVCYVTAGTKTYFSNGSEKGVVEEKVASSWTAGSYVGKDSTKTVSDPPAGHVMEVAFGRLWVAKENFLYNSEPFSYNQFDYARCVTLHQGKISLLKAVTGGLYVGDDRGIFFYSGSSTKDFEVLQVSNSRAIFGAVVRELISGISLGLQDTYLYCLFAAEDGIYAGGPGGKLVNLTEDRIAFPALTTGRASLKGNGNILFIFDS